MNMLLPPPPVPTEDATDTQSLTSDGGWDKHSDWVLEGWMEMLFWEMQVLCRRGIMKKKTDLVVSDSSSATEKFDLTMQVFR